MKPRPTLLFALAVSAAILGPPTVPAAPQRDYIRETPAQRDARLAWFSQARFGMFIHWGLYSEAAGEWDGKRTSGLGEWIMHDLQIPDSQYAKLVPKFNPVEFDARRWVGLAKEAGVRYIVITSKHHDGFGMWRSGLTDWCIKSTPFQRDPLKELAAACKAEGLRLCFYYSIMDWHNPDYVPRKSWNDLASPHPDFEKYVDYMKGQLRELLTGYGPIGILWFDGEWDDSWTSQRGKDLYNYVRSLQPDIIVNNRVGKARDGMQGMNKATNAVGDYGTPEQQIPPTGFGPGVYWESCMTMNDTWGFKKGDHKWKSAQTLIRNLVDCASKGGNYLLNVGPTSEGLFPAPSVERLKEIGRWMKVNHESIYGTTASPFEKLEFGRCTQKAISNGKTRLYLHVFDRPENGKLALPGLANKPVQAFLLASGRQLETSTDENRIAVTLPAELSDGNDTVVALDITGTPEIIKQQP